MLLAFPAERERWFVYRSEVLHYHIQTWVEHTKIDVANPPPWGRVEQPEEPVEVVRAVPSGEAPGEILRRQARELLDEIPAAEMPSALAFLEFLRDRGPSTLLQGGPGGQGGGGLERRTMELDSADISDDEGRPDEAAASAR